MGWFAQQYDSENVEYWKAVGMLHDLDFEQWPEQHCVKCQELMRQAGIDAPLSHFSFCTNGSGFCGVAGIPTVGFGPSRENLAHTADEYIEISQLERACRGFQGILRALTVG